MTSAEMKRCPDCAEMVLAAARRCRYCGYRFDRRAQSAGGWLAQNLLRGPPRGEDVALPTLLEEWDITLAPGEEVRFFRYGELDGRAGYLLVSDRRLLFLVVQGRSDPRPAAEHPLGEVARAQVRGALRRQLELAGAGWSHRARLDSREDLELLLALLAGEGGGEGRDRAR